jgi:hypothetical protein
VEASFFGSPERFLFKEPLLSFLEDPTSDRAARAIEAIFAVLAIQHVSNCGLLVPYIIEVEAV